MKQFFASPFLYLLFVKSCVFYFIENTFQLPRKMISDAVFRRKPSGNSPFPAASFDRFRALPEYCFHKISGSCGFLGRLFDLGCREIVSILGLFSMHHSVIRSVSYSNGGYRRDALMCCFLKITVNHRDCLTSIPGEFILTNSMCQKNHKQYRRYIHSYN